MRDIDREDGRLVVAARAGDQDAFSELIMRHADRIFRVTHRITRHREDAEDAVQESIANAFVHLASFTGASRFSTWLTRIAINAALLRLRRKRWSREVPMEEPKEPGSRPAFCAVIDASPNPEESYAKYELDRILKVAIARLRPTLRKTVEVYGLQQNTLQETAQILGISTTAVKARIFHARRALRREAGLRAIFGRNRGVVGSTCKAGGNFSRARGQFCPRQRIRGSPANTEHVEGRHRARLRESGNRSGSAAISENVLPEVANGGKL